MATDPLLQDVTADGGFRRKVAAGLDSIAVKHKNGAKIASAKRTLEQQRAKVAAGTSQTLKSYHRKRGKDGGSLAVDVCDKKLGWDTGKRFWLLVGSYALAKNLGWGGLFGLKPLQKYRVRDAIIRLRAKGWPKDDPDYDVVIGWDAAHWQTDSNWP